MVDTAENREPIRIEQTPTGLVIRVDRGPFARFSAPRISTEQLVELEQYFGSLEVFKWVAALDGIT